jgi:arsenate reductase
MNRPHVLFLCVHNAGRSQMAAAFARLLGGDDVVVQSAGSDPADALTPAVVEAMHAVGIDLDLDGATPVGLTDEIARRADVIVTMGCGDACPVYPGKRYVDWALADPAGRSLEEVRTIRDTIRTLVEGLLAELRVGPG